MQHRRMETSLDELFNDAITRLLMQRDGVAEDVLRQLLRDVKKARRVERPVAPLTPTATALRVGVAG